MLDIYHIITLNICLNLTLEVKFLQTYVDNTNCNFTKIETSPPTFI